MLSTAVLMTASLVVGQAEREQIPTEAITELSRFVGVWEMVGEEGDDSYKAEYHFEPVKGNYALRFQCRWSGAWEGRGFGMMAWDGSKKEIFSPEGYDDGSICRLHYRIEKPGVLIGETQNSLANKGEYKARIRLKFEDKDCYTWTATEATLDGEAQPDMTLRFTRVK